MLVIELSNTEKKKQIQFMLRLSPCYSVSIKFCWGTLKNLETCVILTCHVLCQQINSKLMFSLLRNAENWRTMWETRISTVVLILYVTELYTNCLDFRNLCYFHSYGMLCLRLDSTIASLFRNTQHWKTV